MSLFKSGISALGKLLTVAGLAAMFLIGMGAVLYMSLQGEEVKVPEIVGKNFADSEKELASLGLRIKKRADRYSEEQPNTVLEQLPRPGETVKTGQMILVVTSKPNPEGEEKPATIKKGTEEDDSDKIEELISDKPKKKPSNSNSNVNKKKAETTRDVLTDDANTSAATSATNTKTGDPEEKKEEKGTVTPPANKQSTPANTNRPAPKPAGTDLRPRRTPQP